MFHPKRSISIRPVEQTEQNLQKLPLNYKIEHQNPFPLPVTTTITDVPGAVRRDPIGATAALGTVTTAVVEAIPEAFRAADPGRIPPGIKQPEAIRKLKI